MTIFGRPVPSIVRQLSAMPNVTEIHVDYKAAALRLEDENARLRDEINALEARIASHHKALWEKA